MRTAPRAGALSALALVRLTLPPAVQAGPADELVTPIVEEGEREVDFKAGTARLRDGTRDSQSVLGLGFGVTRWWFTEVYMLGRKLSGESWKTEASEWENRFQLTETGRYPVDFGLLLEIERPRTRSEGYEIRWGPLLQADLTTKLQANLNLLFEKHVRAEQGGKAELGYQWGLKYRYRPELEFGLMGLGDVGPWNDWEPHSEQPHSAGPIVFGRFKVGQRQTIKYNAALLGGLSDGAPRTTFRMQVEYEF